MSASGKEVFGICVWVSYWKRYGTHVLKSNFYALIKRQWRDSGQAPHTISKQNGQIEVGTQSLAKVKHF